MSQNAVLEQQQATPSQGWRANDELRHDRTDEACKSPSIWDVPESEAARQAAVFCGGALPVRVPEECVGDSLSQVEESSNGWYPASGRRNIGSQQYFEDDEDKSELDLEFDNLRENAELLSQQADCNWEQHLIVW